MYIFHVCFNNLLFCPAEYVGIDVGKHVLEVAIEGCSGSHTYDNTKAGWHLLWKDLKKKLCNALVVVETTGWYEKGIMHYLINKKVFVHRAPARLVKQFILSYGTLAKTDRIDSQYLAKYAKERAEQLVEYSIPDKVQERLTALFGRYHDLVKMLVQEKNRLEAPENKLVVTSINAVIKAMEKQKSIVLKAIDALIAGNVILQQKMKVLQTVDGIGKITALALLAHMPELGDLNRKQAASLAGLAPHARDSGTKSGYRKVRGGRENVKEILYMAAMGVLRKKESVLKDFYKKLVEESAKKKMVALTAVKRKIVVIANARLAEMDYI